MGTFTSPSAQDTEALGFAWGQAAQAGWVFGLTGDLGAGKTHLARGLARGLGVTGRIQSPTFALVNEHRNGRLPLYHLDLYRLESAEQILGAGLEPYLFPRDGVAVIEWYERWPGPHAPGLRRLHLRLVDETTRTITYDVAGA